MAVVTLNTIAEQVELIYGGGSLSRDNNLEREDVELLVRQVSSQVVSDHLKIKHSQFDYVTDFHFIHAYYNQAVIEDVNTGLYSTDIPTVPFALEENRGVLEIYPGKNIQNPYMPMAAGTVGFFTDALRGEVGYTLERGKIMFHNMCKKVPSVTMKLVLVAPEELDPNEQVYLPYEMQHLIVVGVLKLLGLENPEDQINDQIDTSTANG